MFVGGILLTILASHFLGSVGDKAGAFWILIIGGFSVPPVAAAFWVTMDH